MSRIVRCSLIQARSTASPDLPHAEIKQAAQQAVAAGDAEQLGKEGHGLTAAAVVVHDILTADPTFEPESDR